MPAPHLLLASATWLSLASFSALAAGGDSKELHVLSSNVSRPAISEIIPLFENAFGIKVRVQYANNPILKQQIEAGAAFDVVIIEPQMLRELAKEGFVAEGSFAALARIGMSLVSKEGAPAVDIRTVASFKEVLLSADSIAYTADGHSGSVFLRTLAQLGIAEELKPKLIAVTGRLSTAAVAEGSAQFTAIPHPGTVPGVQLAGPFPEEVQTYIGVAAGTSALTEVHHLAAQFLAYLQSDPAMAHFLAKGYTLSAETTT